MPHFMPEALWRHASPGCLRQESLRLVWPSLEFIQKCKGGHINGSSSFIAAISTEVNSSANQLREGVGYSEYVSDSSSSSDDGTEHDSDSADAGETRDCMCFLSPEVLAKMEPDILCQMRY